MNIRELTQQKEKVVCIYRGLDFESVKDYQSKYKDYDTLYIVRSHKNNNKPFVENLMGLSGLIIKEKMQLSSPYEATFYKLNSGDDLVYIDTEWQTLIEYLLNEGINRDVLDVGDIVPHEFR